MRLFGLMIVALAAQAQAPAHFHHLHLNVTDPQSAIDFYTTKLECERRKFGTQDAVFANGSWLLFTKVSAAPKSEITSAIWHMGWGGGDDMRQTYRKQVASGTPFQTPITDIGDQCDGKGGDGRFYFAYIDGPAHALIELNTTAAGETRFGHVHLLSADPIAAAEWYMREFGLRLRNPATPPSHEVRYRCGRQTGPAVSLLMDSVNVIIYPVGNAQAAFPAAWKNRDALESTEGHSIDHIAFRVDHLDATLARLRKDGTKIISQPDKTRPVFIEGPDRIRIEVLEDHTGRP